MQMDYREFLRDYAKKQKIEKKNWSLGQWARQLGLKSTSSLTKVLSGDRDPGPEMIEQFIRFFKLSPDEAHKFRSAVLLAKPQRNLAVSKLIAEQKLDHADAWKARMLTIHVFRLIAEWFHLPVRELARLKDLKFNSKNWGTLFHRKLDSQQIEDSASLLEGLEFITRTQDELISSEENVMTPVQISDTSIRTHHKEMLRLAQERIDDTKVEEREYQALSMLVDEDKIPQVKAAIRDFMTKIENISTDGRADRVYQLQVSFFPLTHQFEKKFEIRKKENPQPHAKTSVSNTENKPGESK
jgi:uncharacterized protein (TIGR02147 family)